MKPLAYIVTIIELALIALLVTVEGIVYKLQMGRCERRRVEIATVRAEKELYRIASDAFISMVEEARVSRRDPGSILNHQVTDEQVRHV